MENCFEEVVRLFQKRKERIARSPPRTTNPLTGEPGYKPLEAFPRGATDAELSHFEEMTSLKLPEDVRALLKITNGAAGFYGVPPTQPGQGILERFEISTDWPCLKWLPIAHDACGCTYIKALDSELYPENPICFREVTTSELSIAVASDALHLAWFMLTEFDYIDIAAGNIRTLWPFNREFVLKHDPNLAKVTNPKLPWGGRRKRVKRA